MMREAFFPLPCGGVVVSPSVYATPRPTRVPPSARAAPCFEPEPRYAILIDTDKAASNMIVRVQRYPGQTLAGYLERDQFEAFRWFPTFGKVVPLIAFGAHVEAEPFNGGVRFRAVVSRPRAVVTTGGREVFFESGNEWSALHERFQSEIWEE